ncbi:NgoFVII family restriction endonuclease [Sulfurimonas sp. SAG-AH-194-L11]|nr:NgoFVII family restriction endonuclease [Sulfurimonas sp. SAG-AH-194-L11]
MKHILIPKNKKTLHSKIYYFQSGNQFTSIIGSANVTVGGLIESEELSIEIKGTLQSKALLRNFLIHYYQKKLRKLFRF